MNNSLIDENKYASVNDPKNKSSSQETSLSELKVEKVKVKEIGNNLDMKIKNIIKSNVKIDNNSNNKDNDLNNSNLNNQNNDLNKKDVNHNKFWYEDISVFFDVNKLLKFFPTPDMNLAEKLNSICRLAIYIGLALFLFNEKSVYLLLIILVLVATYYIYYNKLNIIEKLSNDNIFRKSTKNNPMMNYNIITGKDKNKKAMPVTNLEVKKEIRNNLRKNDVIDDKLYRSTFDLFDKNNSQRQFYTMPSTSMPNDQTAFAKWCYSTGPTCKERNLYCAPNYISLNGKREDLIK